MTTDYFTKEDTYQIIGASGSPVGTDRVTCKFLKLRNASNLKNENTYSITVRHRIVVQGSDWVQGGGYQANGFQDYPILVTVQSGIAQLSDPGAKVVLKKVVPKTINASIEQSSNKSTGSSNSQTNESSSGSSSTNVNTFGVNISAGFFGELPVGSIGVEYSHSWEHSTSESHSAGQGSAHEAQAASGSEMSVKDWSAYSSLHNIAGANDAYRGEFIQWNWGQTYPWNIFDYSEANAQGGILLPQDVVARLYYTPDDTGAAGILLPPSDLSLFGLDFTMVAEWHVTFPAPLTAAETVGFQHTVNVVHASHSLVATTGGGAKQFVAELGGGHLNTYTSEAPIDLGQYALLPLLDGRRAGMGIGFQSNLFDVPPAGAGSTFKIRSRGNDLVVTGSGFSSAMAASFPSGYTGAGATLTIGFKVASLRTEYALLLKHWKGAGSGNVVLTCDVNGNRTAINVVDPEGQGAANNLAQLDLRNFDLRSPNFHDYLVVGWNEISVVILPADASIASEYILSALSVEG